MAIKIKVLKENKKRIDESVMDAIMGAGGIAAAAATLGVTATYLKSALSSGNTSVLDDLRAKVNADAAYADQITKDSREKRTREKEFKKAKYSKQLDQMKADRAPQFQIDIPVKLLQKYAKARRLAERDTTPAGERDAANHHMERFEKMYPGIKNHPDLGLYEALADKNHANKNTDIFENWNMYIEHEKQLDEGFKETIFGILIGMASMGNAAHALDIDVYGSKDKIENVSLKLKADGSLKAAQIATKLKDALKNDYDGSDSIDVSEMSLYPEEAEYLKGIIDAPLPASPEEIPATQGIEDQSAEQKSLFQKLMNKMGFEKSETPAEKKTEPKKDKEEPSIRQKIKDANKKSNAFDKLGKKL